MRIAVIGSKGLPPKQGGIEHHCAEVYPRMVQHGHWVDLYARSSYTKESGVTVYNFKGVSTISLPSLNLRGLDAFANAAIGAILASRKNYDIVHFHALGPAIFTPIPKILSSAKVVATCHGLDWQRAKWGAVSKQLIKAGERIAVKSADALTVVSESLQSYFIETYGYSTHYVGNAPVPLTNLGSQRMFIRALGLSPGRYIVFVGRLVPEKCPDLLIRAFNTLQASGWKLVFVGGASDTNLYSTQLIEQAQVNPNIIFTGELEGERLAEVVRNAGLFVLPSNVEGLPIALLEAMNEKIPVVVSDIPVHQQIVGDDRGLLFKKGDVDDCATCLHWAIQHPAAMAEFAKQAAAYVQHHHNWDDIALTYLNLYECLLKPRMTLARQAVEVGS
jgi:glycosyltransferase involved in cell wall biosynthesis